MAGTMPTRGSSYYVYERCSPSAAKRYVDLEDAAEPFACAVCLEDVHGKSARVHACGHRFHSACIDKWLDVSTTCSTCRGAAAENEEDDDPAVARISAEWNLRRVLPPRIDIPIAFRFEWKPPTFVDPTPDPKPTRRGPQFESRRVKNKPHRNKIKHKGR